MSDQFRGLPVIGNIIMEVIYTSSVEGVIDYYPPLSCHSTYLV